MQQLLRRLGQELRAAGPTRLCKMADDKVADAKSLPISPYSRDHEVRPPSDLHVRRAGSWAVQIKRHLWLRGRPQAGLGECVGMSR